MKSTGACIQVPSLKWNRNAHRAVILYLLLAYLLPLAKKSGYYSMTDMPLYMTDQCFNDPKDL